MRVSFQTVCLFCKCNSISLLPKMLQQNFIQDIKNCSYALQCIFDVYMPGAVSRFPISIIFCLPSLLLGDRWFPQLPLCHFSKLLEVYLFSFIQEVPAPYSVWPPSLFHAFKVRIPQHLFSFDSIQCSTIHFHDISNTLVSFLICHYTISNHLFP